MKTLRRLYVSTIAFTPAQKAERERATRLLEIPGVLEIKNDYRTLPDVLGNLELESDHDIAERSLKEYVSEPGYHTIYLTLTEDEWHELGLRDSLYGQSRNVDGQIITYGRPGTVDYEILDKYEDLIQENFTESTLREWHELVHGLDEIFNLGHDNTHFYFYGYANSKKDKTGKHRRWVRKPRPFDYWNAMPWEQLPSLEKEYKKDLLLEVLQLVLKYYQLLLAKQSKLVKPLKDWGKSVTQDYANYNPSLYPTTGHHIGVDHASPMGTEIYAPATGELVETGYTNTLGYYVVYKYRSNRWLVAIHLDDIGERGKYDAGQVIGVVGDTGLILGIHSHIEVWAKDPTPRTSLPTDFGAKWKEYTRDPLKEF